MEFKTLKANLKKDFSTLPHKASIAVLADSPSQQLCMAIKGYGYEVGLNFDLWEADFDQIERQILDAGSELYEKKPSYVLLFFSAHKLRSYFYKQSMEAQAHFAEKQLAKINELVSVLLQRLSCRVLLFNFPELMDGVYGQFGNKIRHSYTFQSRKLNLGVSELSQQIPNLFVVDVASLQHQSGLELAHNRSFYIQNGMAFGLGFLPEVAKAVTDTVQTISGRFKKCLILDLDNTTWGGIIGDDGLENIQIGDLGIGKAFTELQSWAKNLKNRGIILAVCSKNTESIAKEPFEKHPDMVLRLEDIAVFVANWENKVNNIRFIQSVLNIGFDSMVFLDDNPFERNIVRGEIPELTVPELPEDPADYLPFIQAQNLFETASFSEEDTQRTALYQEEAQRTVFQRSFVNETEFLQSLEMKSKVSGFDKFNTPRVAQLTQRSNQFNLRTVRYTDEDVQRMANSSLYTPLALTLEDKFGDAGLIALVILQEQDQQTAFIDTWIMSCRVLKRGMEDFTLNQLVEAAKAKGYQSLIGEYLPTPKNKMVEDHYPNLGFEKISDNQWKLNLLTFVPKEVAIQSKL